MGRIRTIKPELFRHELLFDMETDESIPYRLIFAGIWTICDREGRFKWRPRSIRAEVFPFDTFDMSRVLDALATRGFVVRYTSGTEEFGYIPSWKQHQFVNNKEPKSVIPEPSSFQQLDSSSTRGQHVLDACVTRGVKEGKGKEGKDACLTPEMIARKVQNEAAVFGDKELRILTDVCRREQGIGIDADSIVSALVGSWQDFTSSAPKLEYSWGAEKFFGQGYWKNKAGWPWKEGMAPKPERIYANQRKDAQ